MKPQSLPRFCKWSVDGGRAPRNTKFVDADNKADTTLTIPAADALLGEYRFTLRVRGATADQTITRDFLLRIL